MAIQVNMHQAKTQLSKLVEHALAGEEVVIAKNGKPLVRLTPYAVPEQDRKPGRFAGQIWIADDFDQTPEEIIRLFEGEDTEE
jgi:prevent-host-death family protein